MPEFHIGILATFAAQILSAVVMAALLYAFNRQYLKSYVEHWQLGWSALATYHVSGALSTVLALYLRLPATHIGRVAVTLIDGVAGYTLIGWMIFGAYELVRRRPVKLLDASRILLGLAAIGAFTSVLFIDAAPVSRSRFLTRVGVR